MIPYRSVRPAVERGAVVDRFFPAGFSGATTTIHCLLVTEILGDGSLLSSASAQYATRSPALSLNFLGSNSTCLEIRRRPVFRAIVFPIAAEFSGPAFPAPRLVQLGADQNRDPRPLSEFPACRPRIRWFRLFAARRFALSAADRGALRCYNGWAGGFRDGFYR